MDVGASGHSPLPHNKMGNMNQSEIRLKCRKCGKEFSFSYEVARRNLRGYLITYPKHCTTCISELNSKERVERPTYPGRDGSPIRQECNDNWRKDGYGLSEYFVYILSMIGTQGVEFYVGHTEDIRDRLRTHLSGQVSSTRSKHPKLVWFCEVSTRAEATRLEAELKGVNDQNSDIIQEMVLSFKNVACQLDYTALQARD